MTTEELGNSLQRFLDHMPNVYKNDAFKRHAAFWGRLCDIAKREGARDDGIRETYKGVAVKIMSLGFAFSTPFRPECFSMWDGVEGMRRYILL